MYNIPVNPPPFRGSLPRKSLIFRIDWVSGAGDINLPHDLPWTKKIKYNKILTYILRSIFLEIPHLELVYMGALCMYINGVLVYGCYIHVYRLCVWVLYTCILMVYMSATYIYIDGGYWCNVHVYWWCIWVLYTCILIVYMGAIYMYIYPINMPFFSIHIDHQYTCI
jgi:hypothetical protein